MDQAVTWIPLCALSDIPQQGSRTFQLGSVPLAVFRTHRDEVFTLVDRCPHAGGPLSQGIVHGRAVTCPLHNWVIDLASGQATGPDSGCTNVVATRLDGERVMICPPDLAEALSEGVADGRDC